MIDPLLLEFLVCSAPNFLKRLFFSSRSLKIFFSYFHWRPGYTERGSQCVLQSWCFCTCGFQLMRPHRMRIAFSAVDAGSAPCSAWPGLERSERRNLWHSRKWIATLWKWLSRLRKETAVMTENQLSLIFSCHSTVEDFITQTSNPQTEQKASDSEKMYQIYSPRRSPSLFFPPTNGGNLFWSCFAYLQESQPFLPKPNPAGKQSKWAWNVWCASRTIVERVTFPHSN